jgi:hypothetical protein
MPPGAGLVERDRGVVDNSEVGVVLRGSIRLHVAQVHTRVHIRHPRNADEAPGNVVDDRDTHVEEVGGPIRRRRMPSDTQRDCLACLLLSVVRVCWAMLVRG